MENTFECICDLILSVSIIAGFEFRMYLNFNVQQTRAKNSLLAQPIRELQRRLNKDKSSVFSGTIKF